MANSHATDHQAPVQEVFSSIQGEGLYAGHRQIFVRFAHCHLHCAYCDTPMTSASGRCEVEMPPGSYQRVLYENPVSVETLLAIIHELRLYGAPHSVSFTGGEPLLYHRFLSALLPRIQPVLPTYLETSGTQPELLKPVLPFVSIMAMDIKFPSATGEAALFEAHREFYELTRLHRETALFIKLVVGPNALEAEWQAVEKIVSDPATPIFIQPVTDLVSRQVTVSAADLLRYQERLSRHFEQVRVLPQTHKMLAVL